MLIDKKAHDIPRGLLGLRGFLAVARNKSFSKAASKEGLSQSAISQQVDALETSLGTTLFSPRTGKIKLTPDGEILLRFGAPLYENIRTLKERFDEARGKASSAEIKIAAFGSVMAYLLPNVVWSFKDKFPNCKLSILSRSRKDILTMVNDGDVHIGIGSFTTVPHGMKYKVFARFNRMLIARKGHPLSEKRDISPKEISSYSLIVPPRGSNTREEIDRAFDKKRIKYTTAMEIVGHEAIKTYVAMDLGVSIMNKYYLDESDKEKLFVKDVSNHFGSAERGIIRKKKGYFPGPAEEFVAMLLTKFKSHRT